MTANQAAPTITINRTGNAPLAFAGRLIAEVSSQAPDGANNHLRNRWHDLAVYRTAAGRYVASVTYRTRWQGEIEHTSAADLDTPGDVATWLRAYCPTDHVTGYPLGAAYDAKRRRLHQELTLGYDDALTRLLAADPAFAERVS